MSRTIFSDVEEALSRVVRRITTHDSRTLDRTFLRETFDPITGNIVQVPIEANFEDSSANAGNILYPHFFISLIKSREDRFTSRAVPYYGRWCREPVATAPGAFEIIVHSSDGIISSAGLDLETGLFQIRKVQSGYLLRLLNGNNKGTYIVDTITVNSMGNHIITVSNTLVENLPSLVFNTISREVVFTEIVDLNTVKVGDIFEDNSSNTFNITSINLQNNFIVIDGVAAPDISEGSKFNRSGNVFQNTDLSLVNFLVMDPDQPIKKQTVSGEVNGTTEYIGVSPEVPIDAYYLVRIDSKEQKQHTQIINRVWEEFNPPRTALPVVRRTGASAEQLLTADITSGGSSTLEIGDNSNFNINDEVFVLDDLNPGRGSIGNYPDPFTSKVIDKIDDDKIILADIVPDSYVVSNCARVVSNAEFLKYMFHFVDHSTKNNDGAQYWVHEFTFWVQIWVSKAEDPAELGVVTDIATPIEDMNGDIIIED